ncbi:iron permease [Trametopsis cervina]|nr:iron permease [Trametopsis cervina]
MNSSGLADEHSSDDGLFLPAVTSGGPSPANPPLKTKKDLRFWLIVVSICVSVFVSALEYAGVSTALPTIVHDLNGDDFVWVASAYALAATALLPASGGMAQIFGRRFTMLAALAIFAVGSALCGAAQSMEWLIAARTVQGIGGGAIQSLTSIILSDMVSLSERATYNGLIGLTWGFACAMGPLIGGALAQRGQWRWLFYLNLPIIGVAMVLVAVCLNLPTPKDTFRAKMARMDWIGNFLIIASSSACVIALTWGGVRFAWSSWHVLVPLIVGLVGMVAFFIYEATLAKEPIVPFSLISNRTTLSGYVQTFIAPVVMMATIYFLPTYYQACKGASPTRSGVEFFGLAMTIGPMLIITGVTIARSQRYRPQLWLAWVLYLIAMGTMSTLHADTPLGKTIGYPVFMGVGGGILYAGTYFPVLAALPVTANAHALAFFAFCRYFAGVWGVTIGTAVLQTQLTKRLPSDFTSQFPQGVAIAYSIIPGIPELPEELQGQVREAFAESIAVIWQVMIGISGIGLLASLFMKGLPLHTYTDAAWTLEGSAESQKARSVEMAVVTAKYEPTT